MQQTAQAQSDIKRVALGCFFDEMLDEMNHQIFFTNTGCAVPLFLRDLVGLRFKIYEALEKMRFA